MNWKKRIVSLVLAAVIGVGTFLSSGVEAEAASVNWASAMAASTVVA